MLVMRFGFRLRYNVRESQGQHNKQNIPDVEIKETYLTPRKQNIQPITITYLTTHKQEKTGCQSKRQLSPTAV